MSKNKGGDNRNGFLGEAYVSPICWSETNFSDFGNLKNGFGGFFSFGYISEFFGIDRSDSGVLPGDDMENDNWEQYLKQKFEIVGVLEKSNDLKGLLDDISKFLETTDVFLDNVKSIFPLYTKEEYLKKVEFYKNELFSFTFKLKESVGKILFEVDNFFDKNKKERDQVLLNIIDFYDNYLNDIGNTVGRLELLMIEIMQSI